MFKSLLTALALSIAVAAPSYAQAWSDCAAQGDTGGAHNNGPSNYNASYEKVDSPGHSCLGSYNEGVKTNSQGAGAPNGPNLQGAPGMAGFVAGASGAAMSGPIMGGFDAPGNLALKAMGMRSLPQTRLDSFVAQSGWRDAIYGDEGTDGPPPYMAFPWFRHIEAGITSDKLTTGHKSDAPMAWDYPQ